MSSAWLLKDNNQNYIITCNDDIEPIKIFDLEGNKIKEIKNFKYNSYFIDTYYDNNLSKIFIITGNGGYSQSYDYNENKIKIIKYIDIDDENKIYHMRIIIDDSDNIIKMIESSCKGIIRIFNFHSGKLLNKVYVYNDWLNSICLANKDYLFVG